jgi:hypothetical protein
MEKCLEDLLHMRRQTMVNSASRESGNVRRRKHINSLEIVSKKSIYGMWTEDILFVKVFLIDPGDKTRLASVLDVSELLCSTAQY